MLFYHFSFSVTKDIFKFKKKQKTVVSFNLSFCELDALIIPSLSLAYLSFCVIVLQFKAIAHANAVSSFYLPMFPSLCFVVIVFCCCFFGCGELSNPSSFCYGTTTVQDDAAPGTQEYIMLRQDSIHSADIRSKGSPFRAKCHEIFCCPLKQAVHKESTEPEGLFTTPPCFDLLMILVSS